MGRVVDPLRSMGAVVLGRDGGRYPPLAIQGGSLRGIDYTLPVASAQVKSALLLAGLYADNPTTLHVPGPARDHTERMLLAMGCQLEPARLDLLSTASDLCLFPGAQPQPVDRIIPGDVSSASFLLVAATLVAGSEILIEGVGVNPTRTGLLDVLRAMGGDLALHEDRIVGGEPVADLTVRSAALRGVEVGGDLVVRMIDEFPVLAVAATQAHGQTRVRDAAELRVKETDRIATTVQELRRLGAEIEAQEDGFVIHGPTPLRNPALAEGGAAALHSHGDHRLAMALAIAGLISEGGATVQDVACITDSFPGFDARLRDLGGDVQ
jgi:3-phosphoshikimate 1-carboxyvinyltransferase